MRIAAGFSEPVAKRQKRVTSESEAFATEPLSKEAKFGALIASDSEFCAFAFWV